MKLLYLDNQSQCFDHEQFLQSWQWVELQETMGNEIIKLGVEDAGQLTALAFITQKNIFGFKYLYCPKGPMLQNAQDKETLTFLFSEIKRIAKEKKCIFLRFEPQAIFALPGFKIHQTIDIQPKSTVVLDLTQSQENLLSAMKQKTRYNIKLAEKKGIEVRESNDLDLFWEIMQATKERDNFRLHSKAHYEKLLNYDRSFIRLFVAFDNEKPLACALINFFNHTATYLHGGSLHEYRQLMAPYLLQWQCILTAKESGHQYYDFYGIDEKKWPGVTRFKLGFGGKTISTPGTFDLIINSLYYGLYNFLRKIRRI